MEFNKTIKGLPFIPVNHIEQVIYPQPYQNMALLDYFAAKAMEANIIANFRVISSELHDRTDEIGPLIASFAYEVAGHMLKEKLKADGLGND